MFDSQSEIGATNDRRKRLVFWYIMAYSFAKFLAESQYLLLDRMKVWFNFFIVKRCLKDLLYFGKFLYQREDLVCFLCCSEASQSSRVSQVETNQLNSKSIGQVDSNRVDRKLLKWPVFDPKWVFLIEILLLPFEKYLFKYFILKL